MLYCMLCQYVSRIHISCITSPQFLPCRTEPVSKGCGLYPVQHLLMRLCCCCCCCCCSHQPIIQNFQYGILAPPLLSTLFWRDASKRRRTSKQAENQRWPVRNALQGAPPICVVQCNINTESARHRKAVDVYSVAHVHKTSSDGCCMAQAAGLRLVECRGFRSTHSLHSFLSRSPLMGHHTLRNVAVGPVRRQCSLRSATAICSIEWGFQR